MSKQIQTDDYRIVEKAGRFWVQRKIIIKKGFFRKKVIEKWRLVDFMGNVCGFHGYVFSVPAIWMDTLDDAKKRIKEYRKGKIIHNC